MKTFKEFISTTKEVTLEDYLENHSSHHDYDDMVAVAGYIGSPIVSVLLFEGWYIFKLENGNFWVEYDRTDSQHTTLLEAQMTFWNGFAKYECGMDSEDMIEDLHDQCITWISTQGKGILGIDEFYSLEGLSDEQKDFSKYLQDQFELIND